MDHLAVVSVGEGIAQFEDESSVGSNASTQAQTDATREASRYMKDLGDFAFGCSSAMSDPDLTNRATSECMEVIRDFNSNMSQLWDQHRETIDYYRAQSAGDRSITGGLGSSLGELMN